MIKVSEGKYKVGDSSALIFIRVSPHHCKQTDCHCEPQDVFVSTFYVYDFMFDFFS